MATFVILINFYEISYFTREALCRKIRKIAKFSITFWTKLLPNSLINSPFISGRIYIVTIKTLQISQCYVIKAIYLRLIWRVSIKNCIRYVNIHFILTCLIYKLGCILYRYCILWKILRGGGMEWPPGKNKVPRKNNEINKVVKRFKNASC